MKRKNHPKDVIRHLKSWFYVHIYNPYPDEQNKKNLSLETGLTVKQINTFYVNERKRNKSYKNLKKNDYFLYEKM
tara:strand:+ start:11445 stop:11669 length:225 start_codon:yes stop_codon:yes gene_type:complete